MTDRPINKTLRRDLRASTIDGAAYGVNVGIGETYLPAFMLAIGGGEVVAGLVATVPMLVGAVLQLVSPHGVRRMGSLRRWVVACAMVQSLSFVPLIAIAILGSAPVWLIFAIAAMYWGSALATGPAWNTWIGSIVPSELRARFFARRSRVSQAAVLGGLLAGGWLLQYAGATEKTVQTFAIVFLIAAVARAVSAVFLMRQSDPQPLPTTFRTVRTRELLSKLRNGDDGRLLLYLLTVTLMVNLASPFFTPFMLGELGHSYTEYMTLIGASYVAKIVALPLLGGIAHRLGPQRLLWIGGIGIVPLSALWCVSTDFAFLLVVQLAAGTLWGAYELATFLLVFEHIPEHERTSVLTLQNFANAMLIVVGSLAGGALLAALGQDRDAYNTVFLASAIARGLTLILMFRVAPIPIRVRPLALRTVAVRPSAGSLDAPIVASMSDIDRNERGG